MKLINQMGKISFKFCIALLLAIYLISCEKDVDPQLKIRITDIPAEYNGMFGSTFLLVDVNEPVYTRRQHAYSLNELITDGAVTTKLLNSESTLENPPHTKKGVYTVIFGIFEEAYGFQILWSETKPIDITKETTTISFNDLINIDIRTNPSTDQVRKIIYYPKYGLKWAENEPEYRKNRI